jgi:hypothetical protein
MWHDARQPCSGAMVQRARGVQVPAIYVAMIVVTVGVGIVFAATLAALARHPDVIVAMGAEREVLINSLIVAILGYAVCMIVLFVRLMKRKPNPRAYSRLFPPPGYVFVLLVGVFGSVGIGNMGVFDVVYFGVGILCVTWVACLLLLKEDPEPVTPGPPTDAHGTSSVGPEVSHGDDPDSQGIRLGSSHTLETNARGVRIKNPWSHYDIPWVAVRGIEIVGAGDGESPVAAGEHYLRFTVDSDANPSGSKAARPDGSGPDTVVPGRLVAVRAHCTQTADVGRLEDLRHRILAARDQQSPNIPVRVVLWRCAARPGSCGTSRRPGRF